MKLLLFMGSPRKNGTSFSFARTFKLLTESRGNEAEIIPIYDYFNGKRDWGELENLLSGSAIIGLISPLYVDSLPYPVIWFLEKLSADFRGELKGKNFFALGQCGFPDTTMLEPLLGSCRLFAQTTEMNWLGGLGYGGGPMINGAHLENLGRKGKKITASFNLVLDDIFAGKPISAYVQDKLTMKFPRILQRPLAAVMNHQARKTAQKNGVDLTSRIYLEDEI